MEQNNNNKPQATQADVINRDQLYARLKEISSGFGDDSTQEDADAYNQLEKQLRELEDSRDWYCQTFERDGKVGVTDCTGTEVLIPAIYDSVPMVWHNDHRWVIPVEQNGRYGFAQLDGKGTLAVPCQFCTFKLVDFGYYFMVKLEEDGKWGVVNLSGVQALPCCADEVFQCIDGNYAYRIGEKWGLAMYDGSLIIDAIYDDVDLEDIGKPYTFVKDGVKGYVYQNGKFISEADYDALTDEEWDALYVLHGLEP